MLCSMSSVCSVTGGKSEMKRISKFIFVEDFHMSTATTTTWCDPVIRYVKNLRRTAKQNCRADLAFDFSEMRHNCVTFNVSKKRDLKLLDLDNIEI